LKFCNGVSAQRTIYGLALNRRWIECDNISIRLNTMWERDAQFMSCQFTAAPATRHELCAFQASTEKTISIRELVNHGAL